MDLPFANLFLPDGVMGQLSESQATQERKST